MGKSAGMIEEGKEYEVNSIADLPVQWRQSLGHGQSGSVAAFEDTTTGTLFALKSISARRPKDRVQIRKTFRNELSVVRGLKHPHIVQIFAAYTSAREYGLFLLPVAENGSLCDFLDEYQETLDESHPCIDARTAILESAIGCLASGLAFMHERSVRHKDIKPRNILVHRGTVIYTDFGYSREFVQLDSSTTEGRPDPYTKRYGAPEVRQEEKRNSSADVYSLGCVFVDIFAALTQAFESDTDTDFSEYATRLRSGDGIATIPSKYGFLRWMILSMLLHEPGTRPRASEVVFQVQQQSGFICNDCGINSNPRARRYRTPVPPDPPNLTSYVATQSDLNATLEKLYKTKRAYHSLRSTQAIRLDVQIIDALTESEFDNKPHQNYGGHSLEVPPLWWTWEGPIWHDPKSAEFSTENFNIYKTMNQLENDMHKLCAKLLYMEIVLANYPSDLRTERVDAFIKEVPFSQLHKAASEKHAGLGLTQDISTGKKVQDWLMDMLEKNTLGKTYLRSFLDPYEVQVSEDETWFDSVSHYWELDGLMHVDNASDTSSMLCELPGLHDEIPTIFITEPTSYNKTDEWERTFGLEYWSQSVLDSLRVSTESVPREDIWENVTQSFLQGSRQEPKKGNEQFCAFCDEEGFFS